LIAQAMATGNCNPLILLGGGLVGTPLWLFRCQATGVECSAPGGTPPGESHLEFVTLI
jgi:hypothetical protein